MTWRNLVRAFEGRFGRRPRLFEAPGRVNIIGEHTDYNDGFVLPMALDRTTAVAAAPRDDGRLRVASLSYPDLVELDLAAPGPPRRRVWYDYVEGVAQALRSRGHTLRGADLLVDSNVPIGAGLSSSAALEMAVGFALLTLADVAVDRRELALAGQQAEHEYVGMPCGIMDQYISAMGKAGQALMLDCRTVESRPAPMRWQGLVFAVCDSKVKHELAGSTYGVRRDECRQGLELLRAVRPEARALRDITPAVMAAREADLPEPIGRRVRHVVTENDRVLRAVDAMARGDAAAVGALLYASHASLRDDYEVSCPELDLLVEATGDMDFVLGARMTGGGFGGCTVNLLRAEAFDDFRAAMAQRYRAATGRDADIIRCVPSDGVREIVD